MWFKQNGVTNNFPNKTIQLVNENLRNVVNMLISHYFRNEVCM